MSVFMNCKITYSLGKVTTENNEKTSETTNNLVSDFQYPKRNHLLLFLVPASTSAKDVETKASKITADFLFNILIRNDQ